MADTVHLVVWSDYLCPWCHLGAARMELLAREFGATLRIEWRAFLLRPAADPRRTLDKFRTYTQSWLRPAAEPDAPEFRPWSTDEGPPSSSIPAHLLAKAAATHGADAFAAMHARILRAYFVENRDVTNRDTQRALWREIGLSDAAFDGIDAPEHLAAVLAEHRDALERGVTGVPAVMMVGNDVPTLGAMTLATYRRWITRTLERS